MVGGVLFASNWRELGDLVLRYPGSPCVVDPGFRANDDLPPDGGSQARFDWGTVPLILYGRSGSAEQDDPGGLGFPLTACLRPDIEDHPEGIASAVLRSIDAQFTHDLLARMEETVDPGVRDILEHALNLAVGPCTVPQLADAMGITERTLQRRCIALGIPSPKTVISLARVFTVERLLHWSRQPLDAVTLAVGVSDRSNYRRLVLRVLGASPAVIRASGGSELFAELILDALGHRFPTPAVAVD